MAKISLLRLSALSILLIGFGKQTFAQNTAACPCAGVTTTVVNGTSGSQSNTGAGAEDWQTVTGTGASYSLGGIFVITMETLTFTIPATAIPAGTRFCSVTGPVPVVTPNANVGLVGYSYNVTGSYLTGYTVTVNVNFTGVDLFGTASVTVSGINYTIVTQTGCPLPVELGNFSGVQNGRCATLEWYTHAEQENDHFTVQKMIDGKFVDIAEIKSLSGSTQQQSDYSFTDCDVSAMNYYRLYQTDDNGVVEYLGDMISVAIDRSETGKLNVVPNPATNLACIYADEDLRTLRIYSSDGRLMAEREFSDVVSQQYCQDLTDFPAGVYTVQVQTETTVRSSQLIKQ